MNYLIIQKIRMSLSSDAPIDALRELAVSLNRAGIGKSEIIDCYRGFSLALRNSGMDEMSDQVDDVLDMMTGYYVGKNVDLD
ncbi:hypothetical protein DDE05_17965 [Streptomyces cavourensis]|nr:hypothetical protein DDE05_17965 [Streptomyces cavourensis]